MKKNMSLYLIPGLEKIQGHRTEQSTHCAVGRHDDDDDDDGDDDDGPPLLQPKDYIDILALSSSGSTQLVHWHTSSHV